MINLAENSLATIVSQNHQTVQILEKHNLDFCCKGKRTLQESCVEKGLSVDMILQELALVTENKIKLAMPFSEMSAEQLINYILINHHFFVKQSMPTILAHIEKVANKHGERFPYMIKVLQLFTSIKEEMTLHMEKEEVVLFPRIKEIEQLVNKNENTKTASTYISNPIRMMEMEHEHAGEMLYEIRKLTSNYTLPDGACSTFRVCLEELKEFEEDLHKHVHLENNLLFPQAEKMTLEK